MKRIQLCGLRRETACWAARVGVLLLCCGAGAAEPSNDGPKEKAKTDDQKVVYLKDVWKPLGPDHNIVLKDKTWNVFNNAGRVVFTRSTRLNRDDPLDTLGYSGGSLYMRSLYHKPTKLKVTVLNADGSAARVLETQPLMRTYISRKQNLVFACGGHVFAEGRSCQMEQVTAYRASTGKQMIGQLPSYQSLTQMILSRPEWKTVYLISGGDYWKSDNPKTLMEFDKDLKKTSSHVISRKGARLAFACTDKDTIYVATTARGGWDFAYYDVKTRKPSDAPFRTPKGSISLNALACGDGKLIVWSNRGIVLYEPRMALRRRPKVIKLPDPKGMAFAQKPGAVAKDGRFALAAHHRSKRPKIVLVYSKKGKLLEQIKIKEGSITHLRFVSEGKELLVFAGEYTARVKLKPLPAEKSTTQPVRQPKVSPKRGGK